MDDDDKDLLAGCGVGAVGYILMGLAPFAIFKLIVFIVGLFKSDDIPPDKGAGTMPYVWVCTGQQSHTFHCNPDCEGLDSCTGDILEISWEQAQDIGRRPCKICHND